MKHWTDLRHSFSIARARVRNRVISTLQTGDMVKTKSIYPFIYHYGIVLREEGGLFVYHNDPDQKNHAGGNIIREPFDEWIQDREIVDVTKTKIDAETIEKGVRELKQMRYDLLSFNCEHFITRFKDARPNSGQVVDWAFSAAIITFAILILRKRK